MKPKNLQTAFFTFCEQELHLHDRIKSTTYTRHVHTIKLKHKIQTIGTYDRYIDIKTILLFPPTNKKKKQKSQCLKCANCIIY